ncbi:PREDICTED: complement decay-accelerating factor, partial [Galeopterus variegatus]|uniref:Complement decay-accelerating factor n=1 Tax=Galeopterus variegatus TaxID=482537 RepID=A0ABM0SIN4_GALVR
MQEVSLVNQGNPGSCDVPPRFLFASLKKTYSNQNYFPVGSAVEYECRLGYRRDPTQSGRITCLESLVWSEPAEFCQKKSCPNPGDLVNGHINITTDILFGSTIYFSCDIGYLLVGSSSSYCEVTGNTVSWSDRFPLCVAIQCPEPPRIANGTILRESNTYVYNQFVTYKCSQGFTLVGEPNIYCIVKDGGGEWTSAPQCK